MKHREQHAETEALEGLEFLDESAPEHGPGAGTLMADQGRADYDPPYDDGEGYGEDYDESYDDEAAHDAGHHLHGAGAQPSGSSLDTLVFAGGVALLFAGVGLMACWSLADSVEAVGSLRQLLAGMDLAPFDVVLLGVVLAGLARLRSHLRRQVDDVAQALQGARSDSGLPEDLQSQLAFLVEAASKSSGQSPQELHRALHLIKRQEEKINNLSKATKMYGKPLIEITNQLTESSHQLADIGSRLDAVKIIAEQSSNRLETTLRSELGKVGGADTSGLKEAIQATRDTVKALEALQRDLSQRLTDKSDKLASDVLNACRDTQRGMESLQQGLEQAHTTIVGAVKAIKLPAPPPPPPPPQAPAEVTDALAKIERQLAGLGQTVSKLGTLAAAAPAAPAAAKPGKPAAKPPAADDGDHEAAPAADSSAGPAKSSTNVMSAIQKLKQLRT